MDGKASREWGFFFADLRLYGISQISYAFAHDCK